MSENNWNHFKIVPQGHNNCQLSIVNCQFGEAAKFQFAASARWLGFPESHYTASREESPAWKEYTGKNTVRNCKR